MVLSVLWGPVLWGVFLSYPGRELKEKISRVFVAHAQAGSLLQYVFFKLWERL
jgi:hypothetical protein